MCIHLFSSPVVHPGVNTVTCLPDGPIFRRSFPSHHAAVYPPATCSCWRCPGRICPLEDVWQDCLSRAQECRQEWVHPGTFGDFPRSSQRNL